MVYHTLQLFNSAMPGSAETLTNNPLGRELNKLLAKHLQRLLALLLTFLDKPFSPQMLYDLEQQLQQEFREIGRLTMEYFLNRLEPDNADSLPMNIEFESVHYTRVKRKTPRTVSTIFGKIDLYRYSYRSTSKTTDPTLFPLEQQLGIMSGATPALAECAARYQAEAGATQKRTLQRLREDHNVQLGAKKLREIVSHVSELMTEHSHDLLVVQLLYLLGEADASKGSCKPVLSVGRDGISYSRSSERRQDI